MDLLEDSNLSSAEALDHWYYRAKFALLRRHLASMALPPDARLADLGCGKGLFLQLLVESGWPAERLVGVDTGFSESVRDPSGFEILPEWPTDEEFDAMLLMDVLEHCPDDSSVLQQATDHLKPGGYMFVTVPAFQWLWSPHDVFLKHFRRYNLGMLRRLFATEPRLETVQLHYFYGLLFPAAVAQRVVARRQKVSRSQLHRLPPALNQVFRMVCAVETGLMRANRLGGLTAVAVCRRIR